jgi:hypothetical protein
MATEIKDSKKVDYGYGPVQALPIPARQRPDIKTDGAPCTILPNGEHVPGKTVEDQRAEVERAQASELGLRTRAAEAEGTTRNRSPKGPVQVQMPSGQRIWVGGEALVSALANGGKLVEEPKMQPTVNGHVAPRDHSPVHFLG